MSGVFHCRQAGRKGFFIPIYVNVSPWKYVMKTLARKLVRKISKQLHRRGWVKSGQRVRTLFLTENENRIDFFIEALFKLPGGLRKQLPIDDDSFTRISGPAHSDCRAYYFYGVCDETLQAAVSSLRWQEIIEGHPLTRPTNAEDRALNRVILDSVVDEQNLWKRKLTEHLVNAISFSQYNSQPYYKAFLAAEELDQHLGIESDLRDFFACKNLNNHHSIETNTQIIADIQKSEGISKLPFLSQSIGPRSLPRVGNVFLPLRTRFKQAITLANDGEKTSLRFSYGQGFSSDSKSIHARASAEPKKWDDRSIQSGLMHVSLIAINLILRAHALTGLPPLGLSEQVARVKKESIAPQLVKSMQRELKVGDIVLAHGDLAEVVGMSTSAFGYTSFTVQYLTRPPIPWIQEDEWPATYINRVIAKEYVREFMEKGLSRTTEGARAWEDLKGLSDHQFHEALKAVLIDLDKRGLLGMMFQQSDGSTPDDH